MIKIKYLCLIYFVLKVLQTIALEYMIYKIESSKYCLLKWISESINKSVNQWMNQWIIVTVYLCKSAVKRPHHFLHELNHVRWTGIKWHVLVFLTILQLTSLRYVLRALRPLSLQQTEAFTSSDMFPICSFSKFIVSGL